MSLSPYRTNGNFSTAARQNRTLPGAEFEKLEEFYSPAVGDERYLVMYRVNGGIVFFERVDQDGDAYEANITAMNARPTDPQCTPLSLSVAQKNFSLKHYGDTPTIIARRMVDDPNVDVTELQSANLKLLAGKISNWWGKPTTKKKYFRHCWQNKLMTKEQLIEIVNILKDCPETIPETDNFFVNSPLFAGIYCCLNCVLSEHYNYNVSLLKHCYFSLFQTCSIKCVWWIITLGIILRNISFFW